MNDIEGENVLPSEKFVILSMAMGPSSPKGHLPPPCLCLTSAEHFPSRCFCSRWLYNYISTSCPPGSSGGDTADSSPNQTFLFCKLGNRLKSTTNNSFAITWTDHWFYLQQVLGIWLSCNDHCIVTKDRYCKKRTPIEIQGKCSNAGSFVLSSYKNNTLSILKHKGNQESTVICKRFPSLEQSIITIISIII